MSHDRRCRELADYFLSHAANEQTRAALAEHIQIEIEAFCREHDNQPHHRGEQPTQ
jgi:hypothetical protein